MFEVFLFSLWSCQASLRVQLYFFSFNLSIPFHDLVFCTVSSSDKIRFSCTLCDAAVASFWPASYSQTRKRQIGRKWELAETNSNAPQRGRKESHSEQWLFRQWQLGWYDCNRCHYICWCFIALLRCTRLSLLARTGWLVWNETKWDYAVNVLSKVKIFLFGVSYFLELLESKM